jgi:hypothetical protein
MFVGSDTDQLRQAAQLIERERSRLESLMKSMTLRADLLDWEGLDASAFRQQADSVASISTIALQVMMTMATSTLIANAGDQDEVSATLDVGLGFGMNRFGGGDAPFPGAPGMTPFLRNPRLPDLFASPDSWPRAETMPWHIRLTPNGEFDPSQLVPDLKLYQADGTADATFKRFEAGGSTQFGGVNASGSASAAFLSAQASGSASASFGANGLAAGASGSAAAYLVQAGVAGAATYGIASLGGSASAFVGAKVDGQAQAHLGTDGVKVSAGVDAFAGAKATAEGELEVGGVGVGAKAEGWAGVGAKADADFEVTAEHVKVGVELGVGLGIGGSLKFEIDIEPQKIWENVEDFFSW